MKLKKLLALLLAGVMVFSLAACSSSSSSSSDDEEEEEEEEEEEDADAEEEEDEDSDSSSSGEVPEITSTDQVTIIWSHNSSEDTAAHEVALMFKEKVEEYSNGNITVTIYPNGELGSVTENDQALREGTIQICSGTAGSTTDDLLAYFDAPNLVDSMEEALEMFGRGTELREYTESIYESIGMKVLSFIPSGFRELTSNVEVRSYEDLEGLNVRTMENPISIEYWSDWGCSATPLAFSELYISLQQGLVDAQENTYDTVVSSLLYEQQKYVIDTHHVVMYSGVYMNLDFFNSLPEDYQELIEYVWEYELDDVSYEMYTEANDEALQTMIDYGLEHIEFTEEDYDAMREAAEPAYELIREYAGDEVMDMIEEILAE